MRDITLHNFPDELHETIKELSAFENRSLDQEISLLLEKGLQYYLERLNEKGDISPDMQVKLWEKLAGSWKDDRTTDAIIADIYNSRTRGREIEL